MIMIMRMGMSLKDRYEDIELGGSIYTALECWTSFVVLPFIII